MANNYAIVYINAFNKKISDSKLCQSDLLLLFYLVNEAKLINDESGFGGNTISISAKEKKEYCKCRNISTKTFERNIKALVDSGLIRRIPNFVGLYQLNPFIWGLGKKEEVKKLQAKSVAAGWFKNPNSSKLPKAPQ